MKQSNTIKELTTAVFDNGRRGNPKPGCDCEHCFGYCLVNEDEAMRKALACGMGRKDQDD